MDKYPDCGDTVLWYETPFSAPQQAKVRSNVGGGVLNLLVGDRNIDNVPNVHNANMAAWAAGAWDRVGRG